ncbi:response regulator [Actibacterium sp. MT2.3-13A]|uniref:response regulator n=1 Tax=Actibacterium sp. MT2.3-13A TaxID=2828332 RepID=UPI001BADE211|nr:response regulator [Actibacterium sp. MT2.3-13A]
MRFLAVDDDPAILEIISDFMERDGRHGVQTVSSAPEALRMAQANPLAFDAFLLDIQMPEMNGVELCSALRALPPHRQTPIIMVTRLSERNYIDDAFAAGATDYINKPLDPLEWKSRINMVERLHNERQRSNALAMQVQTGQGDFAHAVDFETPISFQMQGGVIEYLALENYLLTLDGRGLFSHAAMGIHVENALHIHNRAEPTVFIETLGDVAAAIFEGLRTKNCLFSYAGNGDFVAVMPRQTAIDVESLEFEINNALAEFEVVYAADGLPTPRVRVGQQVRGSLFGSRKATAILNQAITKARFPSEQEKSEETLALQIRKMLA